MAKYSYTSILSYLIPILGFLIYGNTLKHGYTLDDIPIIQDNAILKEPGAVSKIFKSHYWAGKPNANDKGLYRPLTLTSYAIQYKLSGSNPAPYHWANAILHALVCLLIIVTIKLLFKSEFIAFSSAFLFAVHPIHTEAVSGIVGRAELLCLLFLLLTIYLFFKSAYQKKSRQWIFLAGALMTSIFAALSKELGFLTPVFIILCLLTYVPKKKLSPFKLPQISILVAMTLSLIITWIIRASIVSGTVTHELWHSVSTSERIATAMRTCLEYIGMLLFPINLSADYWSTEVPVTGFDNPIVWFSILIVLASLGLAFVYRKKMPGFTWGICFLMISLFPVSNIPFAIGVLKAERILYSPSLGFIVALTSLLYLIYQNKKYRKIVLISLLIYGSALALRTWMRNPAWKNNYTLSNASVITSPNSPRMNNILGQALKRQGKDQESLYYLERAVLSRPQHLSAVVNLALMKNKSGDLSGAIRLLERGLQYNRDHFEAGANLIGFYRTAGRLDEGIILGERLLKVYPNSAPIMTNLGNIYYDQGQLRKAQNLWDRAKVQK